MYYLNFLRWKYFHIYSIKTVLVAGVSEINKHGSRLCCHGWKKDKYDNYKDLVNDNYYEVPIAHETMGSWAPDSLKFMKDLGSRVSEVTGEKRAKSFLFQSLSMNLQRGNALCVMGTVAHHRKLEEIYNLGTIQTQED
jgi:hypothetical protein